MAIDGQSASTFRQSLVPTWAWVRLTLRLSNTLDDYSEKYGMMGGLVQKPVTAVPVVPSSWASDWPAELLGFWLASVAPAAEILIGPKPRKAEIDGKVHHALLVLAIFWVIIYKVLVLDNLRFNSIELPPCYPWELVWFCHISADNTIPKGIWIGPAS